MKVEKILKYLDDVDLAKECYRDTNLNYSIAAIARLIRKSETTVSNMIMGKHPKSVTNYLKENCNGPSE